MNGTQQALAAVALVVWCFAFGVWWASKPSDRSWWNR
jgi:hypothetical protein